MIGRNGKLPEFVVAGAMKCGTTVLRRALQSHPELYMPDTELNFFNHHWSRGLRWYQSRFPTTRVAGEKTPGYLSDPRALVRMQGVLPDVKVIVLLRDPCVRFVSHFHHLNRQRPPEARWRNLRRFLETSQAVDAFWRGIYVSQISNLLSVFPRDRVLVLYNEEMRADTASVCMRVHSFLGVTPHLSHRSPLPERTLANKRVREMLVDYYRVSNRLLYELLGDTQILRWVGMPYHPEFCG